MAKKNLFFIGLACTAFLALLLHADAGLQGAREGLAICWQTILPSLLPYFILAGLLTRLGIPALLSRWLTPLMSRLFRVSGAGAGAFILGISGGYPLGAAAVAELYRTGEADAAVCARLLAFCNNSGPAFILGAVGVGVFGDIRLGLLLYLIHVFSALLTGLLLARRGGPYAPGPLPPRVQVIPFSQALTASVSAALSALVRICGFVVFFSVVTRVLWALGPIQAIPLALHQVLGLELQWLRALLAGVLELGGGIAGLAGLPASPVNLALASFILGWGGLSVQCQTLAVLADTPIKTALHWAGRFLIGGLSAAITYVVVTLL